MRLRQIQWLYRMNPDLRPPRPEQVQFQIHAALAIRQGIRSADRRQQPLAGIQHKLEQQFFFSGRQAHALQLHRPFPCLRQPALFQHPLRIPPSAIPAVEVTRHHHFGVWRQLQSVGRRIEQERHQPLRKQIPRPPGIRHLGHHLGPGHRHRRVHRRHWRDARRQTLPEKHSNQVGPVNGRSLNHCRGQFDLAIQIDRQHPIRSRLPFAIDDKFELMLPQTRPQRPHVQLPHPPPSIGPLHSVPSRHPMSPPLGHWLPLPLSSWRW